MPVIKRRKQYDHSPTQSSSSSRKLFVDYPYPTLTELEKMYEQQQQKQSDHFYTAKSLRRYKDYLNKMFDTLHGLQNHNSLTSTLEEPIKQSHIDEYSSKAHVNKLQKIIKSFHNKQLFARSIPSMINVHEEQNNEQHVRKQNMTSVNHHMNFDPG
ncbi:unnamed protein product [Rotaria sordida]|uniref:Uncharacterized protein n=1 Tax=Rotaria sordida TaxID=392033 RepID=A0A818I037_9BILA|nr:unnamed protein product [Rotaria sordida]CAF1378795.1 unnamed protein product [Rotaria sordida]CAF3511277.1 unnamed protein product [Rotaria sordida]CAF3649120.1 unnamed protein product [Rotaria sordida]